MIDAIEQLRALLATGGGERSAAGLRQAIGKVKADEQHLEQQALLQALLGQDRTPRLLAESSRRDLNLLLDLHHRLLTSRLMLEACLFRGERGRPLPQRRTGAATAMATTFQATKATGHVTVPCGPDSEVSLALVAAELSQGFKPFDAGIDGAVDLPAGESFQTFAATEVGLVVFTVLRTLHNLELIRGLLTEQLLLLMTGTPRRSTSRRCW